MPVVVHSHIPKTAGSALNQRYLLPRFAGEKIAALYAARFSSSTRVPPEVTAHVASAALVTGHVPYGYLDEVRDDAVYVSLFRDPVERFLSFASYVITARNHGILGDFSFDVRPIARDDPDRFVGLLLDNPAVARLQFDVMTRLASGMAFRGGRSAEPRDLERAMANLKRPNYLFGIQEGFDAFVGRLAERFGTIAKPAEVTANQEKRFEFRIHQASISSQTVVRIRDAQDLDRQLYDVVVHDLGR